MEGASGGISSIIETTKTKLLVLSSLLGVGTIFYMTKNYLQQGHFFPSWYGSSSTQSRELETSKQRMTVIGGKGPVVIKENVDSHGSPSGKKMFQRQRSRRNSVSSRRSRSRISSQKILATPTNEKPDINLNKAITELDKSVAEVEQILGLKNNLSVNNRSSKIIEGEIERLRNLLNYAQDLKLVQSKSGEFLSKQKHVTVEEDLLEICNVHELESSENYDDIVQSVYNNRASFENDNSDYDSDDDSFISAAESVELQVTEEEVQDHVSFERKLKELIKKYSQEDFLMYGIEYLTHYGVALRNVRSDLVQCENDVDFSVKVFCLRKAFKTLLKNTEHKEWFVKAGKELLVTLLKKANYDHYQFSIDYDEIIQYCEEIANWGAIDEELSRRGVCCLNFYDIVLDFMIMDSLEDLQHPPSSVTSAIQNRWLSVRIKETALSTAIWTVIKSKKRMLQNPDGFFSKFYDVSMHLTPLLAWGFLGPVKELNDICSSFKDNMMGFMRDIFSTEIVRYKSVQTLSEDIFRIAKSRKEQLLTALS